MAIDSRQKRSSALNIGQGWRAILGPPGTIDLADQRVVAFSYSGISTTVTVGPFKRLYATSALLKELYATSAKLKDLYATSEGG